MGSKLETGIRHRALALIGCLVAAAAASCASPYQGQVLGLHGGDYMALPGDFNGQGRVALADGGAEARTARLEEARFEAAYHGQVNTNGQTGTTARCFADFLASCFGAR